MKNMYICINKDGYPSTKSIRHVNANVNTWKEEVPKVQGMLMQM